MLASFVAFCREHFSFDQLTILSVDREDSATGRIQIAEGGNAASPPDAAIPLKGTVHEKVLAQQGTILEKASGMEGWTAGAVLSDATGNMGTLVLSGEGSNTPQLDWLTLAARELASWIRWWDAFAQVRRNASEDALTGLLNYRSFQSRLCEEMLRAQRYDDKLVLVILDLDKFKRINDTYGHLFGDLVLSETAGVLRRSVRTVDIVARYGGEEFAIILVNAGLDQVMGSVRRVVANVAENVIERDSVQVVMTISAGLAEFPSAGATAEALIAAADRAMYEVKRRGGNGVESVPTTVAAS